MLKDRYDLRHTKHSAQVIATDFLNGMEKQNTVAGFLCAFVLQSFMQKLWNYSQSRGTKKPARIGLSQKEALAFHLAYQNGFINNDCPYVTEIFINIDRSLQTEITSNAELIDSVDGSRQPEELNQLIEGQ